MEFLARATLIVFCCVTIYGSDFEKVAISGMRDVASASSTPSAWGDFDNDNDLDLLITGSTYTGLWRNDQGVFSRVALPGMPSLSESSVAWGDYDNDGRLDLLIVGLTIVGNSTVNVSQLWRNTETGFVRIPIAGLPGVFAGSAAWVDFDRDGRLDFCITGSRTFLSGPLVSELWRNTGSGFARFEVPGLPGTKEGGFAWGDYDRDGYPDFIIAGSTNPEFGGIPDPVTKLWRNTGSGFDEVAMAGLEPISGIPSWADYNQDGRLDFVIAGSQKTELWRNTENGFEKVSDLGIPGVFGPAIWGDYNNDGWDDLFVTGGMLDSSYSHLWRNTGDGFAPDTVIGLTQLGVASVAWGDYDRDGRLDFFQTGYDGDSQQKYFSELWRNVLAASNSPPSAPQGLSYEIGNEIRLHWLPAVDGTNATGSLTYNIRIGSAPGLSDIVSPHADLLSGFRRVAAPGNAGYDTNAVLQLPAGRYYWSVQAIGAGFAGGPFAAESVITTAPTLSVAQNGSQVVISWSPNLLGFTFEEAVNLADGWLPSNRGNSQPIKISDLGKPGYFRLRKL